MGGNAPGLAYCCSVRCQVARQLALEDPEILQRYLGESLGRNAKIFGEHLGRRMGEPVGHQQRIEFAGVAVIKADHKFATVRAETLQRMRLACRKIPEVSFAYVGDVWPACGV